MDTVCSLSVVPQAIKTRIDVIPVEKCVSLTKLIAFKAVYKLVVISVNYLFNVPFWCTLDGPWHFLQTAKLWPQSWMKRNIGFSVGCSGLVVMFCEGVALYAVSCCVGRFYVQCLLYWIRSEAWAFLVLYVAEYFIGLVCLCINHMF